MLQRYDFTLIVVTDLDGTLLDHETYSYASALPALCRLKACRIPLVLNSSKTAAELREIRTSLDNHEPFVAENGATFYVPHAGPDGKEALTCRGFGMNRAQIVRVAGELREREGFRFTGFSEMSPTDLIACTGLDLASAERALQREFTEPLLWRDSEKNLQVFVSLLQEHGIGVVRGGRFVHLSSLADKGTVMDFLKRHYGKPRIIALGDSQNDVAMLERADYPVLVKSPVNPFPEVRHPALIKTELPGPAGWNEAVNALLDELTPS